MKLGQQSRKLGEPHPLVEVLRHRRLELGLTTREVHALGGPTAGQVSMYEGACYTPSLPVFERWAEALSMELALVLKDGTE